MNDQIKSEMTSYDPLLPDEGAAEVLNSTKSSVKQSRYTGLLYGKPAPKFIKMGRSAKYRLSELLKFRDQFPEYQNTSECLASEEAPCIK